MTHTQSRCPDCDKRAYCCCWAEQNDHEYAARDIARARKNIGFAAFICAIAVVAGVAVGVAVGVR